MPYIKQEDRPPMDEVVQIMFENGVVPDGRLNYLLFSYAKNYPNHGNMGRWVRDGRAHEPSYNFYKELIGELHCAITEIERRLLAPYEDEKEKENGSVGYV